MNQGDMMNKKQFFNKMHYILEYHSLHPVWRNKYVYAVAKPLICGASLVFENKEQLEHYINNYNKWMA
jgi:hypothetical protein